MPGPNPDQMKQNLGVERGHLCSVKAPQLILMCKKDYHLSLPSAILFTIAFLVLLYSLLSGEKHCILNNEIV